jgi:hypothetical protein
MLELFRRFDPRAPRHPGAHAADRGGVAIGGDDDGDRVINRGIITP